MIEFSSFFEFYKLSFEIMLSRSAYNLLKLSVE
jgi:hypothetical protein